MEHPSYTTTDTLDQAEEAILTVSISDEALEAAADTERRRWEIITSYTGPVICGINPFCH